METRARDRVPLVAGAEGVLYEVTGATEVLRWCNMEAGSGDYYFETRGNVRFDEARRVVESVEGHHGGRRSLMYEGGGS